MNVNARTRNGTYLNGVLTMIAGLLVVLVAQSTIGVPGVDTVQAADRVTAAPTTAREPMGIPNAADQRARMIASLDAIDGRLARIESALSKPLDVKVIDMPETKSDSKKPE
jgi:hypothetical protein